MTKLYGLVGKDIDYSFSKDYFTAKFEQLKIKAIYQNFSLDYIEDLPTTLAIHIENLNGLNITIPYKEEVFKYLDEVEEHAKKIGAVNTIKIVDKQFLKGYNTDYIGFKNSIEPLLKLYHKKALIFGTGGASKAVKYALQLFGIEYKLVSRTKAKADYTYADLTKEVLAQYTILINCTPIGTFPKIEEILPINFEYVTNKHLLYDLVYNPAESKFLQKGKLQGATTKNGYEMLKIQAEESWEIWSI